MTSILQHPRQLCALGGQQSVAAIERAIPILHAGPGCGFKLHTGLGSYNGYQGGGYSGGAAIVSTNTGEKEVVFGGETRLRSVIDGALKVMDGDLFVVLSGCTSELVGDDTEHVVSEYRQRGIPIVYAATGGFRGSNIIGHEIVAKAIIDQLLEPRNVIPGLMNVWSSVPYQDAFWAGNLASIRELLTGLGLKPNILFGPNSGGLEAWRRIPAAQFNLVLSSWAGVSIVRHLEERFGTPWLHCPTLPIGGIETSRFLREVQAFTQVDTAVANSFIQEQERSFHYFFERAADFFLEFRWDMPGDFVTITDSFYGIGVSRLLTNEFGLLPLHQFVTDDPPDEFRRSIQEDYAKIAPGISSDVTFTSDGEEINNILRAAASSSPIVLGSVWDRDIAQELGGCHLSLSSPITDRLVTSCSYLGYNGGLRLIEDLYSSILTLTQ
jgi:nitrogenase molybdenum-iron protein beta chain